MKPITEEKRRELRTLLKAAYDAVAAEPVPQCFHDQLNRMERKNR